MKSPPAAAHETELRRNVAGALAFGVYLVESYEDNVWLYMFCILAISTVKLYTMPAQWKQGYQGEVY